MQFAVLFLIAGALTAQGVEQLQQSARAAYSKGDYASARQSLDQAWKLLQPSPASDPQRYQVLKQLSATLSASGDYAAAADYVGQAIDWREKAIGPDDPKLPGEWIELATLCQRLKDFPRALSLLQLSMSAHVRDGGMTSLAVADDLSRMALADVDEKNPQRDPNLAARELVHAIEIRETVLGAEHPAILSELDRLAAIQLRLRDYENAESTLRRALVIRERLVGPVSADLISTVEGWLTRNSA